MSSRCTPYVLFLGVIGLVSCSTDGARTASLAESVVGETLRLPRLDEFGKEIPGRPIRLFSLPCGGCADLSGLLATANSKQPLVLVTSDANAIRALPDVRSRPGVFVVHDPAAEYVPRTILDYPPVALRVDGNGRVSAQESGAAQVFAFLDVPSQLGEAMPAGGKSD